jgi:UDP-N-acetyl-D-glucosamine dehydrogenase
VPSNNHHAASLSRKIENKSARIGIVGLGYVGLPLAVEFARAGFKVVGIDVDERKVRSVNAGVSNIEDVASETLAPLVKRGLVRAQSDYKGAGSLDAILIAVPTPLRKTKDPDISYIVSSLDAIAPQIRAGQLIVLESTTYPGTTEEVLRPQLEERGLKAGPRLLPRLLPERVDPSNPVYQTKNTPKVVGGSTAACTKVAALLYRQAIDTVHPVSSTQAAEMIKLLENTFRAVNIGLVNEIALMCEKLGLDVWEVIDGAATKPFGFMRFYPGPGDRRPLHPARPALPRLEAQDAELLRALHRAGERDQRPHARGRRPPRDRDPERARKSVKGSKILVLGAAYKRDTGDTRESPALDVIRLLQEEGATVRFHDPYAASIRLESGTVQKGTPLTKKVLRDADLVIIVTDHSAFDYPAIVRDARRVLDTRNATRSVRASRGKVEKL